MALGGLDHAGGLCGDERLEVHEVQKGRLDELAIDDRAHDADHRLSGKHDLALRRGVDGEIELVPAQELKERRFEHGAAAGRREGRQVVDILVGKDEILDELSDLASSAGNSVAPAKGILSEKRVEAGLGTKEPGLPETLSHGQLIQVGVEADVG